MAEFEKLLLKFKKDANKTYLDNAELELKCAEEKFKKTILDFFITITKAPGFCLHGLQSAA